MACCPDRAPGFVSRSPPGSDVRPRSSIASLDRPSMPGSPVRRGLGFSSSRGRVRFPAVRRIRACEARNSFVHFSSCKLLGFGRADGLGFVPETRVGKDGRRRSRGIAGDLLPCGHAARVLTCASERVRGAIERHGVRCPIQEEKPRKLAWSETGVKDCVDDSVRPFAVLPGSGGDVAARRKPSRAVAGGSPSRAEAGRLGVRFREDGETTGSSARSAGPGDVGQALPDGEILVPTGRKSRVNSAP